MRVGRVVIPVNGTVLLVLVAALFVVAELMLGPWRLDFGWDETVYLSQVDPHVPAAVFTAPRARGVTWLVAPVAVLTSSLLAVRLYLIVVSAAGLVLAFRVWLPVVGAATAVTGAFLFGCLWQSEVYGNEVYPNFWIALLALAAVGWAARCPDGGKRAHWRLGLCVCAVALLRPGDAGWLWLALLAAAASYQPWRRARIAPVSTVGLAVGVLPWVVEAETSYGGVLRRLAKSSGIEGGLSPHLGFLQQARALYGPLQCRPCTHATHPLIYDAWWLFVPILIAVALILSRGSGQRPPLALATATAVGMAAPYLLLVGYANPRFLLPAYAIGAIPVAAGLVRIAETTTRRHRPHVSFALALAILAFAGAQAAATAGITRFEDTRRGNYRLTATWITNRAHLSGPCLVAGSQAPPIGYEAGCASDGGTLDPSVAGDPVQRALQRHTPVVVLVAPSETTPAFAVDWPATRIQLNDTTITAYTHQPHNR